MKRLLLATAFALAGGLTQPGLIVPGFTHVGIALAAGPNGDCTCRHEGGDVIEGQTACVRTAKGAQLARCERFLNNTSWKFLDQPCPTAALETAPTTILR